MAILCSTSLSVTLAISFILLQAFTVSSIGEETVPTPNATAEQEHPDLLPPKVLELCSQTKTAVCPKGQPETEPLCQEYAKSVGGLEAGCDGDNSCAFKVNLTNGMEKFVYVSAGKSPSRSPTTIYKKCSNKLVLYTFYNPTNPNAIGG